MSANLIKNFRKIIHKRENYTLMFQITIVNNYRFLVCTIVIFYTAGGTAKASTANDLRLR